MQLPFFVTPLYAALCGILLVLLSLRVVSGRFSRRVSLGDGGHDDLRQAVRAQANFTEYVPLALILLFLLELSRQAPVWALHLLGSALLLGRVVHAWGILSSARMPQPGRAIGIGLTWTTILTAAIWLLVIALTRPL
ncbi:MAG TPA: MAPEG family protein [Ferrovibrio sp.]|jgi:uncharacterized membrane protein YecN with MAPEG domain|uniref:MAPEG family protein n=1 Tax=Ferrovibrio sp. TaxID=1917215 RepID=UPI002ED0EAFD